MVEADQKLIYNDSKTVHKIFEVNMQNLTSVSEIYSKHMVLTMCQACSKYITFINSMFIYKYVYICVYVIYTYINSFILTTEHIVICPKSKSY